MSRFYTDNWGEESSRDNPKDWSGWPLWQDWAALYHWRDGADFAAHDVIAWREAILVNLNARRPDKPKKWVTRGERLVIAQVRQIDPDWVYLVVLNSTGDEALLPEDKIKRRLKNITRNGVRRWPRRGPISAEDVTPMESGAPSGASVLVSDQCDEERPRRIRSRFYAPSAGSVPPRRGGPKL